MAGRAARDIRNGPLRLVVIRLSHSSSVMVSILETLNTPALFTRTFWRAKRLFDLGYSVLCIVRFGDIADNGGGFGATNRCANFGDGFIQLVFAPAEQRYFGAFAC